MPRGPVCQRPVEEGCGSEVQAWAGSTSLQQPALYGLGVLFMAAIGCAPTGITRYGVDDLLSIGSKPFLQGWRSLQAGQRPLA
jgi:hypothetical protein